MSGFFEEVQRRKVYRVAAAYVIAAGFIIQIGSAVFPAWELPNWTFRLVVVLLLIGFPIALILAWAYDVTPQGIRATPTPSTPGSHRRRNVIMLIGIGVIISAAAGFFLLPRVSARKVEKSIAVLPFQNLSDEKQNAYFADGMQDDILTNLSKIGDLKVISRMSVMSYRGDGVRNAREIGKALGVATLLEGSVRRIGNRVRVSVQLINADDDEHIWAEDYDRDLTDVFAIQSDIAKTIAEQLRSKLSPREKAAIEEQPTKDITAHDLYVRAKLLNESSSFSSRRLEKLVEAAGLLDQAVARDPDFLLAHCLLANTHGIIYFYGEDHTPSRVALAEAAVNAASRLRPGAGETHLARADLFYRCYLDYD